MQTSIATHPILTLFVMLKESPYHTMLYHISYHTISLAQHMEVRMCERHTYGKNSTMVVVVVVVVNVVVVLVLVVVVSVVAVVVLVTVVVRVLVVLLWASRRCLLVMLAVPLTF